VTVRRDLPTFGVSCSNAGVSIDNCRAMLDHLGVNALSLMGRVPVMSAVLGRFHSSC